MCDPNLLCSTKAVLQFLLNCKNCIYFTVSTLDDKFFNYVGCRIPYYDLGYRFLETFFQSIPDVLWIDPFSKLVYPSNCVYQMHSSNVPAYCKAPTLSNVFQTQGLPWNPGKFNWSTYNKTQWKQQRNHFDCHTNGNAQNEIRPMSIRRQSSQQLRSNNVTISSSKVQDQTATQIEKSVKLLEDQAKRDVILLNSRKCGGEESPSSGDDQQNIIADAVTHETSITKSKKAIRFSNYENVTPTTIQSPDKDKINGSHIHNDDRNYNGSRVDTNVIENENMLCVDIKEDDIVDPVPALPDRHNANSDNKEAILNSPDSTEPPPYSEMDMAKFAGATANSNYNLNSLPQLCVDSKSSDDELIQESAQSNYDRFASSDSSEDEGSTKSNNPNLYNNGAIPYFIAHDDPILMIGSKFLHKRYGGNPKTINVEIKMEVGRFYELYISEVNSPYKFWFQLVEDNCCELSDLEKQLNSFYNTSSIHSDDLIDEIYMAKGYPCAAFYSQQWHRAEFLEKPEDKKVKIFFVDYGTVAKVSTCDIRYLLNTFCRLPRLCFRGTLDFIRPTHRRWTDEATASFCELIRDVKLVAGVSEINTKDNSVRIYVMDSSKSSIVNCKLVEDGYAFPEDPRDRWQDHIADLFPTFDSLEKGEYPSLMEIREYSVQGINAERVFETKIIDGVDCYITSFMSDEKAMETIQKFYREKEKAREIASKRDATMFMRFFERMLKNPFLNGEAFRVDEMKNVSSKNPFFHDLDDSTDPIQ